VDSFGIGVHNVIRQCHLRYSFGLTSLHLSATKLQAYQRSEMEQVCVCDLSAHERAKRLCFAAVGDSQLNLPEPLSRLAGQWMFHSCVNPSALNLPSTTGVQIRRRLFVEIEIVHHVAGCPC